MSLYYEIKVFVHTQESRAHVKLNPDGDTDLDLYATRPMRLNADKIDAVYPHKDKRATQVDMAHESYVVPIKYDAFCEMMDNKKYIEC